MQFYLNMLDNATFIVYKTTLSYKTVADKSFALVISSINCYNEKKMNKIQTVLTISYNKVYKIYNQSSFTELLGIQPNFRY